MQDSKNALDPDGGICVYLRRFIGLRENPDRRPGPCCRDFPAWEDFASLRPEAGGSIRCMVPHFSEIYRQRFVFPETPPFNPSGFRAVVNDAAGILNRLGYITPAFRNSALAGDFIIYENARFFPSQFFMNATPEKTLLPMHHPNNFGAMSHLTPILSVEGLIKIYGKRRVVDGVSFHVHHGEVVGLLGPNGAGKTTSFRMSCGLIETNGGIVFLDGQDVTNWPMYRRSREGGMGYLPQAESVFRNLSVQDNLLGVMEMLGMRRRVRKARCDELLEKFKLTHLRKNRGSGLSGGERRRLEIARALVSNPKIILLDEPFANIDPITVHSIQEIIRQLSLEGISILITDHQVRETLQITQRSYVIRSGQVLCHGTPEEVVNNEEAREVYFGNDVAIGTTSSVYLPPSAVTVPAALSPDSRAASQAASISGSSILSTAPGRPSSAANRLNDPGEPRSLSGQQVTSVPLRPRPRIVPTDKTASPLERSVEAKPIRPVTHEAAASPAVPKRPVVRPKFRDESKTPAGHSGSSSVSTVSAGMPAEENDGVSPSIMSHVHRFLWGTKKQG